MKASDITKTKPTEMKLPHEPPIWLGYGMLAILVALILLAIAVRSGAFGGQSDLETFKATVEGGLP